MSWALAFLLLVVFQRLCELALARRNTLKLKADGWQETGAGHYPLIVAFHALWLLGLFVMLPQAQVNNWLIAVFGVLQLLRLWVLQSLGGRWTTRVLFKPDETLIARGPYRFMNHPNYAVVAAEIFVLPLALGFPVYAAVAGIINLCLLGLRISIEEAALRRHWDI